MKVFDKACHLIMRFVTTLKWFVDYVYYMCASVFLCLKCTLLSKSHWDYPLCSVIYSHRAKCLQKFIPTPDKKRTVSLLWAIEQMLSLNVYLFGVMTACMWVYLIKLAVQSFHYTFFFQYKCNIQVCLWSFAALEVLLM